MRLFYNFQTLCSHFEFITSGNIRVTWSLLRAIWQTSLVSLWGFGDGVASFLQSICRKLGITIRNFLLRKKTVFKLGYENYFERRNFWPRMASEVGWRSQPQTTSSHWASCNLCPNLEKWFLLWFFNTGNSAYQLAASEATESGSLRSALCAKH